MKFRIVVNPIACDGRGICAELFPEIISKDDWGFPIVKDAEFDERLSEHARRACDACPVNALSVKRMS